MPREYNSIYSCAPADYNILDSHSGAKKRLPILQHEQGEGRKTATPPRSLLVLTAFRLFVVLLDFIALNIIIQ